MEIIGEWLSQPLLSNLKRTVGAQRGWCRHWPLSTNWKKCLKSAWYSALSAPGTASEVRALLLQPVHQANVGGDRWRTGPASLAEHLGIQNVVLGLLLCCLVCQKWHPFTWKMQMGWIGKKSQEFSLQVGSPRLLLQNKLARQYFHKMPGQPTKC